MLRGARGKTRLDHIRNEGIGWKEAHVKPVETFLENKRRFGHCLAAEATTQPHLCDIARLEVYGRSRGRPKKRWRDNIQGEMKNYQLTEDMAQDRT